MTRNEALDFCQNMRQVLKRLSEIVQGNGDDWKEGKDFLLSHFHWDRGLFCRFVGFVNAELKITPIPQPLLVDILTEIISAGITIGWSDGYESLERFRKVS